MAEELVVKVRQKGRNEGMSLYKNTIQTTDAQSLALIFQDLITMFNIPFWKAVALVKQEKDKIFPFAP